MTTVETISYKTSIEGLTFEQPVLIKDAPSPIRHIEMTVREPEVSMIFYLDPDAELAQVRVHAQKLAERLLDTLALLYKVSVGSARYAGYKGCADDGSQVVVLHDKLGVSDKVTCSVTIACPMADPFQQALRQPSDVNQSMFRLALNQPDRVTRFMLLYWILLQLNNDKQQQVETQIKRFEPTVPRTPSPKNNEPETIYTRLRNELAHSRDGVAPQKTWCEIQTQVGGLAEIVKKVLVELH